MFTPIKKKGIGFIMGNHEDKYLQKTESHVGKRICAGLDMPFLGYTALIRLRIPTKTYEDWCPVIYAMHGESSAQTSGGQIAYLKKKSAPFLCDAAVMSHVHTRGIDNNEMYLGLNDDATDVIAYSRHYAIAGAFMRTYWVNIDGVAGYAEKKHYPPSALGCSILRFYPDDRVIRARDYWSK